MPTELGLLTALTYLTMHMTAMTGPIVTQLGLLTLLRTLDIDYMDLEGTIPTEVCVGRSVRLSQPRFISWVA